MGELGEYYEHGRDGIEQDGEKALALYKIRKATEHTSRHSGCQPEYHWGHSKVVHCHIQGISIPQDLQKAEELLEEFKDADYRRSDDFFYQDYFELGEANLAAGNREKAKELFLYVRRGAQARNMHDLNSRVMANLENMRRDYLDNLFPGITDNDPLTIPPPPNTPPTHYDHGVIPLKGKTWFGLSPYLQAIDQEEELSNLDQEIADLETTNANEGPSKSRWNYDSNYLASRSYGNVETMQLGETDIRYQQALNNNKEHFGNYFMDDLGTYKNEIYSFLELITQKKSLAETKEKEKQLACLMRNYSRTGVPPTLEDLHTICDDTTQEDLKKLQRIFYHCSIKEIVRRMLPSKAESEIPWAIIHARALKLLAEGYLRLKDVFSHDAPYGIFTDTNVMSDIDKLKEKIANIDRVYNEMILKNHPMHRNNYNTFFKDHQDFQIVPTREQLHQELKEQFGGDSDSDGAEYDSSDEELSNETYRQKYQEKNPSIDPEDNDSSSEEDIINDTQTPQTEKKKRKREAGDEGEEYMPSPKRRKVT